MKICVSLIILILSNLGSSLIGSGSSFVFSVSLKNSSTFFLKRLENNKSFEPSVFVINGEVKA